MNQVLIRLTLALFSAPLAAFSHMPGSHTHTHTHFLTLGIPFPTSLISSGLSSNRPALQFPGGWESELGGLPAGGSSLGYTAAGWVS